MLTAGVIGRSPDLLRSALDHGAGGVVAGSFGLKSKAGHKSPIVVPIRSPLHQRPIGYLNAVGFENQGLDAFLHDWEMSYGNEDLPLVISVYGLKVAEFAELARKVDDSPAKALELNLSSPNTAMAGLDQGRDRKKVKRAVELATTHTSKPVFVKIAPTLSDVKDVALAAVEAGAKGIVATNTAKAMVIDIESGKPILTNRTGGLSGPALHPISLRCVFEVRQALDEHGYRGTPVIGCGGVSSWQDVVEFMCAGATAVEIGTGLILESPNPDESFELFKEINENVIAYLSRTSRSLKDLVGMAQR
jgi:dihydroorotate dehydrogenase (NAD+) catalytic subunit